MAAIFCTTTTQSFLRKLYFHIQMKCVGSLWSDDSDCGSPFIEMENHDKKCRTGGEYIVYKRCLRIFKSHCHCNGANLENCLGKNYVSRM